MNCQDVQRYCIEHAGEPLDARFQEHLDNCAPCRLAHDRAARVVRLVGLKRHEQPDAHFEMRNLAALRDRLAHTQPALGWAERLRALFEGEAAPAFRYAMAAAVVAMVGVNVMLLQNMPSLNAPSEQVSETTAPAAEPMQLASTNGSAEPYSKPVFVFEYPSNRQPYRPLQYGPGSVPVRFDL